MRPDPARQRYADALGHGIFKFWVPGIAVPEGNLSVSRHGHIYHTDDKRLTEWRYDIAWRARKLMRENNYPVHAGPVAIVVDFVQYRPKATAKSKPTPPAIKKPDVDKLMRSVLDALTHHVYVDDSQVVDLHARKRIAHHGEKTGATIEVELM